MKRLLKVVVIIALLGFPVFAQEQPTEAERTVFIATSGKGTRYHFENCRALQKSEKIEISITDAKKRGFTPCGVCKPGE